MSTTIKFENVSKLYRLGEVGTGTLAHDLHRAWAKLLGKPDPFAKVGQINDRTQASASSSKAESSASYVWALRDINFEVQQGEILGIIGRNGAGKSTLLKLLSRITAPSNGFIKSRGRIASLLEVGTGFHPELTGRENIYLNGTILGMRRHEIKKQLDGIVEFSGCAKYIDTPVKRFSSGMTVRLGFAVAAHLDCEILVVDEVLAVGDAEFQKRCIGRMSTIAKDGKTILFVSHNMASISNLCSHGLLFESGQVSEKKCVHEAVKQYLQRYNEAASVLQVNRIPRTLGVYPAIHDVWIEDKEENRVRSILMGHEFTVCIAFSFPMDIPVPLPLTIGFGIEDSNKTRVFSVSNDLLGRDSVFDRRSGIARFTITEPRLNQGIFYLSPSITSAGTEWLDAIESASSFEVNLSDVFNTGKTLTTNQGLTFSHSSVEFRTNTND